MSCTVILNVRLYSIIKFSLFTSLMVCCVFKSRNCTTAGYIICDVYLNTDPSVPMNDLCHHINATCFSLIPIVANPDNLFTFDS